MDEMKILLSENEIPRAWYNINADMPVGPQPVLHPGTLQPVIHAGGLRYHGMAPSVSVLVEHGDIEARSVRQLETFEAAMQFMRAEGIIPAPESAHAIRAAIDEAIKCRVSGAKQVIAFNLSGHGHFDMSAYEQYLHGQLQDYEYPEEMVKEAMAHLPQVPV